MATGILAGLIQIKTVTGLPEMMGDAISPTTMAINGLRLPVCRLGNFIALPQIMQSPIKFTAVYRTMEPGWDHL